MLQTDGRAAAAEMIVVRRTAFRTEERFKGRLVRAIRKRKGREEGFDG
jgi:hypothetical protein